MPINAECAQTAYATEAGIPTLSSGQVAYAIDTKKWFYWNPPAKESHISVIAVGPEGTF